jgi:hypothetical protein
MARDYRSYMRKLPGLEILEKVKMCKRLASQRALRLKLEADAAAGLSKGI